MFKRIVQRKTNFTFISALLAGAFLGLLSHITSAKPDSYDAALHTGIKTVVVSNSSITNTPLSFDEINEVAVKSLQKKLQIPVSVRTSAEFGSGYATADNKEKNVLYLHFTFKIWPAVTFSPALNHDILTLVLEQKRYIDDPAAQLVSSDGGRGYTFQVLISLPDEKGDRSERIRKAIDRILEYQVVCFINCANGQSCEHVYSK